MRSLFRSGDTRASAPLRGFACDTRALDIEPSLEIIAYSPDEMAEWFHGIVSYISILSANWVIRYRYDVPVVVQRPGESSWTPLDPNAGRGRNPEDLIERVQLALNVFKKGGCYCPCVVQRSRSLFERGSRLQLPQRPGNDLSMSSYKLSAEEASDFKSFWERFRCDAVQKCRWLKIAVERFNDGVSEGVKGGAIVDFIVAAEALFLSDSGNPKERGELRYRLALRAAALLAQFGKPATETYDVMRRGYDLRSSLVHGGAAADTLELAEVCSRVEEVLRLSLRIAIERVSGGKSAQSLEDWNALILGSLAGHRQA